MTGPLHGMPLAQKRRIRAQCRPLFDALMKMEGSHVMMFVVADPEAPTDRVAVQFFEGVGPGMPDPSDAIDRTTAEFAKSEPGGLDRLCAYMTWFLGRDIQHHRRLILHSVDLMVRPVVLSTMSTISSGGGIH